MAALVPAPGRLHRRNILAEGSSLGVDACATGCRDIVRDKRKALRSIPLPFHRTALSSWSLGGIAVRLGDFGVAVDLDLHRDAGRKRVGVRAGMDRTQVHGTRSPIVILVSGAQSGFSLQSEVVELIM